MSTPRVTARASYCFDGPSCLELISKPADERIVRLLASGGVPVREWRDAEGPATVGGPSLTFNEVLDLHDLLETDGWFDDLLELLRFESDRR